MATHRLVISPSITRSTATVPSPTEIGMPWRSLVSAGRASSPSRSGSAKIAKKPIQLSSTTSLSGSAYGRDQEAPATGAEVVHQQQRCTVRGIVPGRDRRAGGRAKARAAHRRAPAATRTTPPSPIEISSLGQTRCSVEPRSPVAVVGRSRRAYASV